MTATEDAAAPRAGFADSMAVYLRPRVLMVILFGFSSGLPLALSGATLSVWMADRGVDLKTIGLLSLVGMPYTFKFLWAPLVDALDVPLLSRLLGRRRGWLLFAQILLLAAIVYLGFQDPVAAPWMVALGALLVAAASATQDIVIDAFRVESLETNEQAAGMAGYVAAYRIGMLASGAGVVALVAWFEYIGVARDTVWLWGYLAAAVLMLIGIVTTLAAREPASPARPQHDASANPLRRVVATAVGAFGEFLTRDSAVAILLFVVLYKFCDAFAGVLTAAFVIDIGFDKATYAAIVKGVGLAAALLGGFAGGMIARGLAAVHQPVGRRHPADGVQPRVLLAGAGRRQYGGAHRHHRGGEFHRRDRHGDFRRLSVGACAAIARTLRPSSRCSPRSLAVGRTTLASGGGFVAEASGWFWFFAITALVGDPEPHPAVPGCSAAGISISSCPRRSRPPTIDRTRRDRQRARQNGVRWRIAAASVPSSR